MDWCFVGKFLVAGKALVDIRRPSYGLALPPALVSDRIILATINGRIVSTLDKIAV